MILMPTKRQLQYYIKSLEALLNSQAPINRPPGFFTIGVADNQTLYIDELAMKLSEDPTLDLLAIGKDLTNNAPGTDVVIRKLIKDKTIAFAVAYEKMVRSPQPGSNVHNLTRPEVKDDEPVAATRTRIVLGMDILGRVYYVYRPVGQRAISMPSGAQPTLSGTLPKAMRMLCLAVAERMPDAADYLKALSRVEILADGELPEHIEKFHS